MPVIKLREEFVSSHRQGRLSSALGPKDITALLGGVQPRRGSADGKCQYTWDFTVDGQHLEYEE